MAPKQHITELHIKNYRQFRRLHLDFCDPETNEPLEKICFIGPNGTGKSTLLSLLSKVCQPDFILQRHNSTINQDTLVCWQLQLDENYYYILQFFDPNDSSASHWILPHCIEDSEEWHYLWSDNISFSVDDSLYSHFSTIARECQQVFSQIALQPNSNDLAIHSLAEGSQITGRVPSTSLNSALSLFKHLPAFHQSNTGNLNDFWNFLIYQIKRRERDYQTFLASETVQTLSVAEARYQFNIAHPEILDELAKQRI